MQSCRSCKHLVAHPDADGKVRIRKGAAYKCAHIPELPPLPDAVTQNLSWLWPPSKSRMMADEGTSCPTWEKRA